MAGKEASHLRASPSARFDADGIVDSLDEGHENGERYEGVGSWRHVSCAVQPSLK